MNSSYISGYFDGEGTLGVEYGVYHSGINSGRTRVAFKVSIKSGDIEVLKAIAKIYGGTVCPVKLRDNWRVAVYQWRLSGEKARVFLSSLNCISKQPQIDAWISAWDSYIKEKDKSLKLEIAKQAKEHNQRLKRWNYREDKTWER